MKEGSPQRTDYTYFPDEQEREILAVADPQQLAEIFLHQPEMLPQFLFELWRTNRQEEMFSVLITTRDDLPIVPLLGEEMVVSLALAHTVYGVTLDTCRDFLWETFNLVERAMNGKSKESPLDPDCEVEIKDIVTQIVARIEESKKSYISKLN